MTAAKSAKILQSFSDRKVLLVGDLILDIHHYGAPQGISIEAPVLVGHHKESRVSYGGAGLVAENILALGGGLTFVSVVGNDAYAKHYKNFSHKNLRKKIFSEPGRKTVVKERFLIGDHKVLRWNRLDEKQISKKTEQGIISFVKKNLKFFDKLIISDYRHGLLTKKLVGVLIREAKKQKKPVYVDSQIAQNKGNHVWYRGASLICLNQKEAAAVDRSFDRRFLKKSLMRLERILKSPNIIVKLGERGSANLITKDYFMTSAHKVNAVDAVGAGDAFFAALALAENPPKKSDIELASIWAALSTTIRGTRPPSLGVLKAELRSL